MSTQNRPIWWVLVLGVLLFTGSLAKGQTPSNLRLLVLLRDASELAIVDPVAEKVVGQIPTVKDPHEVTASADGRFAYVASPREGIAVIDLAAEKELRRLDIDPRSRPHDVRFAGGKLYFTIEGFKAIGRYDPPTDQIDWLLGIGQDTTHMLVLSKDLNTIFTVNRGSNSVTVAEGVSSGPPNWKLTTIPVNGKAPEGIDVSPDGREVWTATRGDGGVSIIDVATKKVTQRLNLKMEDANRLKFTPDGGRVLISDGEGSSLVVLDAVARKEIKRLNLAPNAVLVQPDGLRAFAALREGNSVAVVDLKTLKVTGQITTGPGSGPGCMFWLETE